MSVNKTVLERYFKCIKSKAMVSIIVLIDVNDFRTCLKWMRLSKHSNLKPWITFILEFMTFTNQAMVLILISQRFGRRTMILLNQCFCWKVNSSEDWCIYREKDQQVVFRYRNYFAIFVLILWINRIKIMKTPVQQSSLSVFFLYYMDCEKYLLEFCQMVHSSSEMLFLSWNSIYSRKLKVHLRPICCLSITIDFLVCDYIIRPCLFHLWNWPFFKVHVPVPCTWLPKTKIILQCFIHHM